MYEYKVNNSPQTSRVALARATLEETINAAASPVPSPSANHGRRRRWRRWQPPSRWRNEGRGGFVAEDGVKICQDPPAALRRAMDLVLTIRSGQANYHRWILWMLLRMPQTFFASTGSVGGCWCARIMEAVLGFLSHQDKYLLNVCHRWSECRVPEGSADELHWASRAWRLLDQMGFRCTHLCFFLPFGFRGSIANLCRLLPS
jgi:hypothetical protein